jgi:hypothetical protein
MSLAVGVPPAVPVADREARTGHERPSDFSAVCTVTE